MPLQFEQLVQNGLKMHLLHIIKKSHVNDSSDLFNILWAPNDIFKTIYEYLVNKILLSEFKWFNFLLRFAGFDFSFYHLQLQNRMSIW